MDAKHSKLYGRLVTYTKNGEYSKGIIVCDKILKEEPNRKDILDAKYLLNLLDKKLDAVDANYEPDNRLYKAYYYYLVRNNEDALKECASLKDDEAVQHLKAQIKFRLNHLSDAMREYEGLLRQSGQGVTAELVSNALACSVRNMDPIALSKKYAVKDPCWELNFNLATALINSDHFDDAIKHLDMAKGQLQEGDDSRPILVQMAYCLQKNGKLAEAEKIYLQVLQASTANDVIAGVATNNLLSVRGFSDLFDAYKRFRLFDTEGLMAKFSLVQKRVIAHNRLMLLMNMQKKSEFEDLAKKLDDPSFAAIVKAANLCEHKKITEAMAVLEESTALEVILAKAQLMLSQSAPLSDVIAQVERLAPEIIKKPGIASLLVNLYERNGQHEKALDMLNALPKTPDFQLGKANFYSRCGMWKEASKIYEDTISSFSGDAETKLKAEAHYIVSSCESRDIKTAILRSKNLPVPDTSDLSVDDLEGSFEITKRATSSKAVENATKDKELIRKEKNRKRFKVARKVKYLKKLIAKGIDPKVHEKSVDPERWIPKTKRKSYQEKKSRRNKAKAKLAGGAQGGNMESSDKFDASKRRNEEETKAPAKRR